MICRGNPCMETQKEGEKVPSLVFYLFLFLLLSTLTSNFSQLPNMYFIWCFKILHKFHQYIIIQLRLLHDWNDPMISELHVFILHELRLLFGRYPLLRASSLVTVIHVDVSIVSPAVFFFFYPSRLGRQSWRLFV